MLIFFLLYHVILGKTLVSEAQDVWKDDDEKDTTYSGEKLDQAVVETIFPGELKPYFSLISPQY